jgi:Zn-dependent peptidase ImmA (M78 family)
MPYIQLNTQQQRSVLASLRALIPNRPLTINESFRTAELQANRLLQRFQVETTAVPEEVVSELPRIQVLREPMPVSGSAHWNGRYWIISVNADEPYLRQRFSVMHEFKHVLDHTRQHFPHSEKSWLAHGEQAERVADYFAACLLMPKKVVTRLWCSGHQDIPALAAKLQVSVPALRYRLAYLGLTEPAPRCEHRAVVRRVSPRSVEPTRYFRAATLAVATGGSV